MKLRTRVVPILLLILVATAAVANARRISHASSSGDFATTVTAGNINRPSKVWVTVSARPNQHISGNWTIVCSKGFGAGSKSGSFSGRTPVRRYMRFPMRHPSSCTASAGGQLDGSGRITVTIWGR